MADRQQPEDEFGQRVETTIQANERAKREQVRREDRKAQKKINQIWARAVLNPDALLILQELFQLTGWDKISLLVNPQTAEINPLTTTFREGRRAVWAEIRNRIPREARIAIENPVPPIVEEDDDE